MRLVLAALAVVAALVTGSVALAGGSARIVWSGSFAAGVAPWTAVQANEGGLTIVPAPAGRPGRAGRFIVRPGDVPINASGERAEVLKFTGEEAGVASFWAWSAYFPRGSTSSPDTSWNIFTQWHQSGPTGVQPLTFEITNEHGREWLRMRVWGGNADHPVKRAWRLAPLVRGRWYDFSFRVRWAPDATGLVQVWLDHREIVPATRTPTLYAGQGVYLKQGFYRSPSKVTSEVYIAGTRRGASLAAIGIGATSKAAPRVPVRPPVTPPAVPAPNTAARPTISGSPKLGGSLKATPGTWSAWATRFAYQWQWSADGGTTWNNVNGAAGATLGPISATFVGDRVRVVVTASSGSRTAQAASAAVTPTT